MSPYPRPTGPHHEEIWTTTNDVVQFFKVSLLVLTCVLVSRLVTIILVRRKRRTANKNQLQEKDSVFYQSLHPPPTPHQPLYQPSQRVTLHPTFEPIYPWVSPPEALPGPYDPRYYPLPTLRRHSFNPTTPISEEKTSISYTRRISTSSIPTRKSLLSGTTTTSSKGWRRTQWTVS